jgi:hypothetical protein
VGAEHSARAEVGTGVGMERVSAEVTRADGESFALDVHLWAAVTPGGLRRWGGTFEDPPVSPFVPGDRCNLVTADGRAAEITVTAFASTTIEFKGETELARPA